MLAMQALQEYTVVLVARHHRACVTHPAIGPPTVAVRSALTGRDRDDQHFTPVIHSHPVDTRKRGRVDLPQFLCDLLDSAVADLLANHPAVGIHAEQYPPTSVVEHS